MKKVRNLVIGGIQQKIFNLVLYTILLIVAAYSAVSYYQAVTITRLEKEAQEKLAQAEDLSAISTINSEATAAILECAKNGKRTIIVLLITTVVLGTISALILANHIVKPLEAMTREIGTLSGEKLQFKMKNDYRTGDEIEVLAESFADLSCETVKYMDEIRQVTAEKERIGTELALATRIQADMLPNIFPPFPDRNEFDIYSTMSSAKEVGGDFYDFFLIDEDHLGIVIADVSGKGVPAALLMMVSKILVQTSAMNGKKPSEALASVNEQLCKNNREDMFVTVWFGILDIKTGVVTAANAGHEYPILKTPSGDFLMYKDHHSFVIGGMSGVRYKSYELQLEPGSKLFLYSDGLPEAADSSFELFGNKRMLDALNRAKDLDPRGILESVSREVADFVGDAPAADDLTMLCLQYYGSNAKQDPLA